MSIAKSGLGRDLDILEAVAAAAPNGVRVTDLASVTQREKSQISRAVARLIDTGLLVRQPKTGRFHLGPKLFAMARYTFEAQLVSIARPEMHALVNILGETVHLTVLQGIDVVTIHSESPVHGFRALSWLGVTAPAHQTSAGRVLLSGLSDAQLNDLFPPEKPLPFNERSRVKNGADLLQVVNQVRQQGFAEVHEEFELGLVGASVPVLDFSGDIVAALNVSAPKERFERHLESAIERMKIATKRLSAAMGSSPKYNR